MYAGQNEDSIFVTRLRLDLRARDEALKRAFHTQSHTSFPTIFSRSLLFLYHI
jgi:hypothetical protein